jgi:tRNA (guanine37-N1)-methyltransferase
MIVCLKVDKSRAEEVKQFLRKKDWIDNSYVMGKGRKYLLFPINKKAKLESLHKFGSIENRSLEKRKIAKGSLKELLKGVIPEEFVDKVIRSYDVVGDIAILEVPEELEKFDKTIAWTLIRSKKNIKTVVKKVGKVEDVYRIRKLKHLEGEKKTETVHRESGVKVKVDIAKVYFTPRSGKERIRIAEQVKKGEKILIAGSGTGAYGLVIAKKHTSARVWMVDLNPEALDSMKDNIELNKFNKKRIIPILGDLRKEIPKLKTKFDRIIMVIPENGWNLLDGLFKGVRKGTIIHFYIFEDKNKLKEADDKINNIAKKANKKVKILNHVRAGTYARDVYRWCIEFKVL